MYKEIDRYIYIYIEKCIGRARERERERERLAVLPGVRIPGFVVYGMQGSGEELVFGV